MTSPAIITVAITGAIPRKADTPDKDRLAKSNAELVARLAGICGEYGRHAATCTEARQILNLPAA